MTQYKQKSLDFVSVDRPEVIEQLTKELLDYINHKPEFNENDVWNNVHNYLKFDISQNLTKSEYDKITIAFQKQYRES